jgi:hypothetical protein
MFLGLLEEVAVSLARFVGVSNFVWSCPRNNLGRFFLGFFVGADFLDGRA